MEKDKILVVDDLPDVRATITGLLNDAGFDVISVSSKSEALRIIKSETFKVAVLDIRLDDTDEDNKDGIFLMHEIKKRHPGVATIILTGYADVKIVREALQPDRNNDTPAFGFLEKSEIDQLGDYVNRAILSTTAKHTTNIKRIISQGENQHVEFKSSARWDYKKNSINKDLQIVIAKSIAGMLNCQGGTLLIGIADDGTILGIEPDLSGLRKPDLDGYHLKITEIIQTHLGLAYTDYIHITFETLEEKTVCVVSIKPSDKPVFLSSNGRSEFWVRVGNSTRQLDVRDATTYIDTHWSKNVR